MDIQLSPAALPGSPQSGSALQRLASMPLRSKLALGSAVLLLGGLLYAGIVAGRQPEWRLLYTSLSDKDGGAVIAALAQMNVPHKFSEGGAAILVPASQVHDARLRLASQGLPKGGTVGFELMENQKFGVTQFQERLNFQRGLEGELARSIMALSAVQSARVHLALPNQTAFMREQQKPSASVLLTLYNGRALERAQIAGIVHLVASSVPELQPKSVSVLDQSGTLLSQLPGDVPNGLDALQLQHVRQTEQSLSQRILGILEPIVGPGNVRAQVTADIDFTQSEYTAESYAPNQGQAPAAVRSQHLSEAPQGGPSGGAGSSGTGAGGSPGALSNQPAAGTPSPVNGTPQAVNQGGGGAGGVKRDAVTNYEVDKTVKVVRNATGALRRLSAAIIVNHASSAGPDGKPVVAPLTPAQMEQINALAREAIGFSKERGDSVQVVNAPFSVSLAPPVAELPLWRQPETLDVVRSVGPWLGLPVLALIIILGLVRPAVRAARLPQPRMLEATVQDPITLGAPPSMQAPAKPALLPTAEAAKLQSRDAQLEGIRQMARQNPATIANVVRDWANQPT